MYLLARAYRYRIFQNCRIYIPIEIPRILLRLDRFFFRSNNLISPSYSLKVIETLIIYATTSAYFWTIVDALHDFRRKMQFVIEILGYL